MSLKIRDNILVEKDGEEIRVWNWINVTPAYQFRGIQEEFPDQHHIEAGGAAGPVDYVTEWVAINLYDILGIELERDRYDIEVVDIESDDVTVL